MLYRWLLPQQTEVLSSQSLGTELQCHFFIVTASLSYHDVLGPSGFKIYPESQPHRSHCYPRAGHYHLSAELAQHLLTHLLGITPHWLFPTAVEGTCEGLKTLHGVPVLTASCLTQSQRHRKWPAQPSTLAPLALGLHLLLLCHLFSPPQPHFPFLEHTRQTLTSGLFCWMFTDIPAYLLPHLFPVFAQTSAKSPLTALFTIPSCVPTAGTLHHLY